MSAGSTSVGCSTHFGQGAQFDLEIVSAEGGVVRISAELVELPALGGQIGVMSGHQSMIAVLDPGEIVVLCSLRRESYVIDGGVAKISPTEVLLLVGCCVNPEKVVPADRLSAMAMERIRDISDCREIVRPSLVAKLKANP